MDPFFQEAVNQARKSLAEGGIPIGSVIVHRACSELMVGFIGEHPHLWKEDIGEE